MTFAQTRTERSHGNIGPELIQAAQTRVEAPFADHFTPDLCRKGEVATEECMRRGLGPAYDCSGLVIASLCDVLELDPSTQWPPSLRHSRQLARLGQTGNPKPGDIVATIPDHVGVVGPDQKLIHALPTGGVVYRERRKGLLGVTVIPPPVLIEEQMRREITC